MVNSATPGTWQFRADIATDEINQATQGARTKANNNKGRFRIGVTNNEELQGGVSVEPYTKDTKFLEVETVDIIKPKALNASDWRSELDILDEGRTTMIKGIKVRGSGHPKDSASGTNENPLVDYSKIRASKETKKEVVASSYEADLENMIIEILEEDINDLHNNGFSYEEIAEFYDIKEELLNEGLIDGAISGAKIIGKYLPKITKFATERGIKDRKILTQFARNPKNWQRANTDIQKVIDAPKNTLNLGKSFRQFADKGYKALKGGAQKLIEPLKKKGEGDIAKWKKTQEVIKRANRLAKSKAEKAGQIVDVAPTTTNLPQAKKSLPLTKNVTKDMSPKDIRSKGMNLLAKLQGKTPKQQKAKELTNRMSNAIDSSKKSTTYSGKVDAALKKPDPGAIVKSSSSAVTAVKPSLDTTKGINMSLSSMASKVKNLLTGKKPSKQLTGTKIPNQLTGTKTKQLELPISKKKPNKLKVAGGLVTGAAAGSAITSQQKDKSIALDPPNKNKSIIDTEKKKVDPKKNPIVSKVDTYKTGKETKSKDVNQWGRSKQYTAKDGTVVDRSDVFTKAAFDFGPNIKKGEKIGVIGHGQRKKYDLEATRRKSVKESATFVKQLPKAFKAVSKLRNATKSNAVQKVFGGASALTGLSGMVRQSKKEDGIPSDINQDAPPDIQKQLNAPQDVRPRSRGEKILKDLLGTKKDPKAMKDKYDKDALDNAKTDSILDPSGTQKTKPTVDQLRKDVKTRKKYKTKSPEIERNQGTMTDKQIERMKKAGLL